MKIQRDNPGIKTPRLPRICIADLVLVLLAAIVLTSVLLATHLVPTAYILGMVFAYLGVAVVVFSLTKNRQRRKLQAAGTVFTAVLLVVSAIAGHYITRTVNAVQSVVNASVERSTVSFYTMQDNAAENLEEMSDANFGILQTLDRANTDATLQQVEAEHGLTLNTIEYGSLIQLADALQNDEVDAIVLNEAYLTLYEETPGYEDFPAQLKAISTQQVEHVVETESKSEQPAEDPILNILISGSDTRESTIDQRGRSDVNIIASINTETHQVLLLSTPRDYFVPLDVGVDDAYDKLTHAGIYGMDVLMGTLENLYGIDIDYYFRINFTGFVDVIDALGGVEVYSDYDFGVGDYYYVQGMNALSGEEALAFARERHSFSEGDRQRGDNQMAVIEAVIQKALSPSILTGYLSILESVEDCIDTSVPYSVLSNLVREQLEDNAAWSIDSFSVNVSDARSTTYSMNQQLYVMIPDEATVQEAKQMLAALGNMVIQDETQPVYTGQSDDSTESALAPAA